jgi:uncharacterized protein (TIGR02217 family)
MSDSVFPDLPGIKWSKVKTPVFNTRIQRATSGKEARAGLYVYPLWRYEWEYEVLRDDTINNELTQIIGFYLSRYGGLQSFLIKDDSDYTVTAQAIATGDALTKDFQLVRTYGGFAEPITDIKASPAPLVYLGGTLQTTGYSIDTTDSGIITFTNAPGNNVVITATFSYYKRVRFEEFGEGDEAFKNFMYQLWECSKISFITAR